jgi:predicted O-linked N-acetylglucosamine transferase (SPINDLY family)
VFAAWTRLLAGAPDAVLWLLADQPEAEAALRAAARRAGIDGDRLVFAPRRPLADHLARYLVADLFLDTLPYNAHTTGSDALWMGCPVLTCRGRTFAARVGASLLTATGLPELITDDLAAYQELGAALLADRPRLAGLRRHLVEQRATAALFDAPRFTRAIETAYETMWRRAVSGQPPEAFAV